MRHASTMKCLIGIILVAAIGSTEEKGIIAQGSADPNVAPNPYRVDEGWAKLAQGRTWGAAVGVDIDRDGKSVWVFEKDVIYVADSQSTDQVNPGYTQGTRIGSVKDGKVTAFIPWTETNTLEGVAADDQGNVYGGYTNTLNFRRFVKK